MKKYAKIINNETKACEVGTGTNTAFYKSIGMSEMDVEQGYDGCWYLKGYAPEKTVKEKEAEVRVVRNSYLEKYVDPKQLVLVWNSLTVDEQKEYIYYRQYLLDYPEEEGWFKHLPMTFEEWKQVADLEQVIASGD